MNSTVRKIDQIGRVVLPMSVRKKYDLEEEGLEVEIIELEEGILIKKHTPQCTFCGSKDELVEHKGKAICKKCLKELSK